MILGLEEVKRWLRIDYDEDEQVELLMDAAKTYLEDSIDDFERKLRNDKEGKFENKAKLVMLTLITNWYDSREFTELDVDEKTRYTIASLMMQMKYGYGDSDG